MSGLTSQGFEFVRLPDLKARLEADLLDAFGQINLAPESVFGQFIGIESEARSIIWQELDNVYGSQYPSTAFGVNLDRVVSINGLTRLPALPTTVRGVATGIVGTVLTVNSLAKNSTTNEFYRLLSTRTISDTVSVGATISVNDVQPSTIYSVTLGGVVTQINSDILPTENAILSFLQSALTVSSTLEDNALILSYPNAQAISVSSNLTIDNVSIFADFSAVETGVRLMPIGALDEIETPIVGWLSITNRDAGVTGRAIETDEQLRIRREQSTRIAATNTLDGIQANLLMLDGVTQARVLDNKTNAVNSDGVPPQHVWAVVQGGLGTDIAQVLYNRVAGGIGTFGSESEIIVSPQNGQQYQINYERPDPIEIYIQVTIEASPNLPTDFVDRIRSALVQFGTSLKIGDDLLYTRLYCPIGNAIDRDSYVTELLVDVVEPPTGTDNILIGNREIAIILAQNIQCLTA